MRSKTNHSQRGAAAVIMVALLGMGALGITASGLMSLKSAQPQQLMILTATQANHRAIAGAHIVKNYLSELDAEDIDKLSGGELPIQSPIDLEIEGAMGISAEVLDIDDMGAGRYRITVNITGRSAQTASVFQVVYEINPSGSAQQVALTGTVSINSNLNLSGSIKVLGSTDAKLMVTGDVSMQGSVSGIDTICATGNLNISSGISVNRICSRGSVTLGGSAKVVNDISAMGNVVLSGGAASATTVNTNSNVTISGGSANAGVVNAKGNVTVSGGNARVTSALNSEGNVEWTSSHFAKIINANGNVLYTAPNSNTVINSGGRVTLSGNGAAAVATEHTPVVLPTLNPVIESAASVDVYLLKEVSNYVFEVDADGKRKVTVRNVSGIVDGVYFLGDYKYENNPPSLARGNKDYLCTAVDSNGFCTAPITPYRTICQGNSPYNGCFAYNKNNQTWTVSGESMAPGTAWFAGSLALGNGAYFNTFLSTGAISTSGSLKVFSPNYAGDAPVCTDSRKGSNYNVSIDYRLSGLYPADLCVSGSYEPSALGNTALMAGGYSSPGMYSGGNITVGASNAIYGSVVAGGLLGTSGSTTIVGAVQVANLANATGAGTTDWIGSTTIDLSNLPKTFKPDVIPCMALGGCGDGFKVRARWSRFL